MLRWVEIGALDFERISGAIVAYQHGCEPDSFGFTVHVQQLGESNAIFSDEQCRRVFRLPFSRHSQPSSISVTKRDQGVKIPASASTSVVRVLLNLRWA